MSSVRTINCSFEDAGGQTQYEAVQSLSFHTATNLMAAIW